MQRLDKYLAEAGLESRRKLRDMVRAGRVTVNGATVRSPEQHIDEMTAVVCLDGQPIARGDRRIVLMMHKPAGCVTAAKDDRYPTVMEYLPAEYRKLMPIGRLDMDTEGLLLFTNDGDLTKQLTHPSYKKKKIYQVTLDKPLSEEDMTKIAEGITLEDGPIFADEVSYVSENRKEVGIEIHSGKNRIVRRIFESLGYSVQKLDRVYFAGLTKKRLKRGGWRFLSPREVSMLKSGEYE